MSIPEIEVFKKIATTIYEKSRDEQKEMAILTITTALVNSYCDGASYMAEDSIQKINLIRYKAQTIA